MHWWIVHKHEVPLFESAQKDDIDSSLETFIHLALPAMQEVRELQISSWQEMYHQMFESSYIQSFFILLLDISFVHIIYTFIIRFQILEMSFLFYRHILHNGSSAIKKQSWVLRLN